MSNSWDLLPFSESVAQLLFRHKMSISTASHVHVKMVVTVAMWLADRGELGGELGRSSLTSSAYINTVYITVYTIYCWSTHIAFDHY